MKSQFLILIISFFFLLYSCKVDNDVQSKINISNSKSDLKLNDTFVNINKSENISYSEFDSCRFIKKYLTFYEQNYLKIYEEDIVNYKKQSIDFNKVNIMFSKLKISENFTKSFENEYIKHLKNIDTEIKSLKKLTEVPIGLDYDYILLSQEVDELLSLIVSEKYKCSKESGCFKITFADTHILFIDINENKIDKISILNPCK